MIQLYLNEQLADVSPSEAIALTYQLNNIAELSNRNGNFSNRITLPLSKTNKTIIEDTDIVTSEGSTPYRVLDCRVFQNGIEVIKKGRAVIQQINTYDFEINIFSGLSNFFQLIEGLTLQDLDFSDSDHTYNLTQINASCNNEYPISFCYPLIDYGLLPETGVTVQALEFYPSVFYRSIIEKIVEAQGFTVSGSILENDLFIRTVSAFSNKEFKNGQRFIDENLFNFVQSSTQSISESETGDTSIDLDFISITPLAFSSFTNTQTISYSVTGTIDFDNLVTVEPPGTSVNFDLVVTKNGIVQNSSVTVNGSQITVTSEVIDFVASDVVELAILTEISIQANNPPLNASIDLDVNNGTFNVLEVDTTITDGVIVNLEATLPELTQEEFLISVFNQFGIIPISDNSERTLTLLTFQDIYTNKSFALDWSQKIDTRAFEKLTKFESYAQQNTLKYAEDETVSGSYDGVINITDTTLERTTDLLTLEYAASDSFTYLDFDLLLASIPILTDNGGVAITEQVEPRCLILDQSSGSEQITLDDGSSTINQLNYKIGRFQDLNFTNLKNNFYNFLENRILDKAQILTLNIKLTETDIKNLDLSKPVYIDFFGGWFYVNNVKEFTSSAQLTECVLIQM